ncbi:filamentous hemagglutinin family protein [Bradyrhizobium sp. Arg237L]|uniref:filamentous haemagglutinin family protein n=1 Tax=Bradyrhizobium sp. Arg237L TaxID=3003352 RepID=UPI00249D9357|nr:filamentous haemagglutinin family protein [Bradyrhizobium sp. Arg237L]MDI4235724.1 filamentous hemagglutinin family protein [Bradyrhizobium sp. Arg237L]
MHSLLRPRLNSRRALLLVGASTVAIAVSSGAHARPFGSWGANTAATQAATAAAQAAAQRAQQAAQNTQASMARAAQAIQALRAAQSAARGLAASAPSSIPNGLNIGGLVPSSGLAAPGVANPVTNWVGANTPTQTTSNGQTTVNIEQTQSQAVLNWQSFNVGRDTTVNFNQQGNASWAALNRLASNASPSQIMGAIKADGAVYLINQNGIIFSGTSQINVHTLIASTLDLSSKLSATNYQGFLQNGLFSLLSDVPQAAGVTGSGAAIFNQGSGTGKVIVQPGAIIDTSAKITSTGDGGYVALLADGGVSNAGRITTQNGQIILASDSSVYLVTPPSNYVGTRTAMQVVAGGGAVTNEAGGLLVSNDGAATLSGGAINQLGGIVATTATTRTGSISLSTVCPQGGCASGASGDIVLGASSLTTILPDESSGTLPTATANSSVTVNGSNGASPYFQAVLQPTIKIQAIGSVDVQGSGTGGAGALIKAPGAALTIGAGIDGTVLLEKGSTIDLSGIAGVTLPMSVNQLSITITSAEVADSPLAKSLIGKTVLIDARVGSPIIDVDGYIGLIPQSIQQILTAGGSFTTSGRNVVQQPGAVIDVSAGYVQYTGGVVTTTRLLGANGRIYDIGSADPNVAYLGLANGFTVLHKVNGTVDPRLTEIYSNPFGGGSYSHYEAAYIAGADAGSVTVAAVNPIVNNIIGNAVAGTRQRAGLDKMPSGASLSITFAKPSTDATSFNPNNVVLQSQADAGADPYGLSGLSFTNGSTWSPTLANGVFSIFTDVLSNASLGSVTITGAHQLDMATNAVLSVRPGGSITLDGVGTIDGTLSASAGKISLTGFTYAVNNPQSPPTPALVIGSNAVLNVRGRWVNDTGLLSDQLEGQAFINGGSVSISTLAAGNASDSGDGTFVDVTQSIVLAPGSIIDVSGGGYVDTTGKLRTGSDGLPVGKGGSLALQTYTSKSGGNRWVLFSNDPQAPANAYNFLPTGTNHPDQANVLFGGTIYAGGFDGGGTLTLQVPTIVIDGAAAEATSYVSSATAARIGSSAAGFAVSDAHTGQLVLSPSFFTSGGFSQYTLNDVYGGTTVTAGTQVVLQQPTVVPPTGGVVQIPTGVPMRDFASARLLPDGLRKPLSLTLNGTSVVIDSGAAIVADPRATVSLVGGNAIVVGPNNITSALGDVTVLGSIVAPGGAINVFGEVSIGSSAVLDVGGVFVPNPRVVAYSTGALLDGGTITLGGNTVVVRPGAQFNLQGAAVAAESNLIQQPQGGLAPRLVGQAAWSNGGKLQLVGSSLYFAGSIDAAGGAPLATGGSLTIGDVAIPSAVASLLPVAVLNLPDAIVIEPAGRVAANLPAPSASPTAGAFIGADTLSNSGFDSVTLNARAAVAFAGSVDVTIPGALTLRADNGHVVLLPAGTGLLPSGIDFANPATFAPACGTGCTIPGIGGTTVNLNAGYVRVVGDTPNQSGSFRSPTLADGTLNVSAQWIDLQGGIALDNIATAGFASTSAIRLLPDSYGFVTSSNGSGRPTSGGALVAPGNLTLKAAEIYPVSNTDFVLMSTGKLDSASTITIAQNGTPTAPLSAGGGILLSARVIEQGGTLWAPLGSIILGVRTAGDVPTQFASALSGVGLGGLLAPSAFTATKSVTLAAGSLTSVSAAGLVIPDGYTVDGTTWYQGSPTDSNRTNNAPPLLSAPPSKSISLFGDRVTTSEGAVLDLNGGGDIYATEFVGGTGGTRNVLTTYQQNLANGAVTPQYDDGRQVYALVPTYQAAVAAYDPNFAYKPYYSGASASSGGAFPNAIAPGQSVTIGPGSSIPAGTYTLLPGMYATLPGAYRVVQVAGNVNPNTPVNFTSPDGSQYVTGKLGNALTGTQSSQTAMFQLQSQAVWSQYSRIDITSGTTFFRNQALAAGKAPPPLPIDGGVLLLGANTSLDLAGTNRFAPGTSALAPGLVGGGGQVQIGGENILVAVREANGELPTRNGYLVLDVDQISDLAASSVMIGGTAKIVDGVQNITATALNLEIDNDAAHPLTGPELLLVSLAGGRGVVVGDGSVVQAIGTVPAGTSRDISFGADPVAQYNSQGVLTGYTAGITGDGSLLRVSNGTVVNVTRFFVPGQYTGPGTPPSSSVPRGAFSVGAGAIIDGGNALTLDTSGSGTLASNAILRAANYDIAGSVINIGGGSSGIVLNDAVLANFNDAVSVRLRSATVINLYDAGGLRIGDPSHPIGTLTFDGAGLYSEGGSTTVSATNITLANSRGATGNGILGTGGTLTLNATGTITEALGAKSLAGFGQINFNAGQAIAFSGSGSLDTGPVAVAALTFNVGGAVITSGGSGYLNSIPDVVISGGGGSGATATALMGVAGFTVFYGGSGYSNGDVVTVLGTDANGNQVKATGTAVVDSNGTITSVRLISSASGFPVSFYDSLTVDSLTGDGSASIDVSSYSVTGVTITNPGAGYTSMPTFSFIDNSGSGGSGAAAKALVNATAITVTGGGNGYVSAPTVTISGGGGSQTTATASVSGLVVSGLNLTQAGTGYSSLPTITFSGGGARSANMLLSAPVIVVNGGATQSVLTSGNVTLATGAGTAPAGVATNIGGALAISGGSITDNATIRALSGNVTLAATAGDVVLGAGAFIDASGSRITVLDLAQDAPGGNVRLVSATGNVTINPGATVSVAAAGNGFAGSLSVVAANTATLDGTLDGHAAFKDLGGDFTLEADRLGGSRVLPLGAGFSSSFTVRLGGGDITVAAGQTLSSDKVLLVANNGSVIVDGTIDASGSTGGEIALYGAGRIVNGSTTGEGGVRIGATAVLNASYVADDPRDPLYSNGTSALVQKGGTITLGTTGTPDKDGTGTITLNATHGYQNVTTSGAISVADGAIFNVSGGPGGANIDNTGGSVIIRAPILTSGGVNVDFRGTVITNADALGNASGGGVVLNAYAVWSTTDGCSLIPGGCSTVTTVAAYNALTPEQQAQLRQHFDGIIDPAGFFDATLTNGKPTQLIFAADGLYPISTIDRPAEGAYMPHVEFYQSALLGFVNNPFNADAVKASFAGAKLQIAGSSAPAVALSSTSMLHLRPGIDLVNPSSTINNGNITVASNWNFGAGAPLGGAGTTLYYRTGAGEPGTLALRALNNVQINATISDGFYQPVAGTPSNAAEAYALETATAAYAAYEGLFQGDLLLFKADAVGFPPAPSLGDAAFFGLDGTTENLNLFNSLQFHLQKPALISDDPNLPGDPILRAQVIDQYNQFYIQYVDMYHAYQVEIVQGNTNAATITGTPAGRGAYFTYADVSRVLRTNFFVTAVLPPSIPVAPTKEVNPYLYYNINGAAAGADYASLWQNYFFDVIDANLQNNGRLISGAPRSLDAALNGKPRTLDNVAGIDAQFCLACFAVTPPSAPLAYLTLFADTYAPMPPPTLPLPSALPPANQIANNPAIYLGMPVYNATAAIALMPAGLGGSKGSFSYDFVAGAAFRSDDTPSVDPNAVIPVSSLPPTVTGNVTIDGHTSYKNVLMPTPDPFGNPSNLIINIPTLVRTGTGSITLAAAGNVELLDQVAPGAVYTAGAATATPGDFKAPTLPRAYTDTPNGLVSTPAWATGGGAVTVTAGGSIIGIEMPTDTDGSQTKVVGAATGQMWSDWYIHYGVSNGSSATPFADCAAAGSIACQTAAWINYATFFQGFGALGGGNITLSAGADIVDVGASLPETLVVGGGLTAANAKATYYGGGNLSVTAGGDLLSSNFLVGRGTGVIRVGGAVQATTSNPLNGGRPTRGITTDDTLGVTGSYALPLLLAVQDGFITLSARGSVTLGNVYDPAALPLNTTVRTPRGYLPGSAGESNSIWSNLFTSYGPGSGISLTSVTGDVTALTVAPAASTGLFAGKAPNEILLPSTIGLLLPATLDLAALSGSIVFNSGTTSIDGIGNANLVPYPTLSGDSTGTINLVAAGSIDLGAGLTMPDIINGTIQYLGSTGGLDYGNYISPLGGPLPILTQALHANDSNPVVIAAGQAIDATGTAGNPAVLKLIKPARIEAGNNIYAATAPSGAPATTGSGAQLKPFVFIGQNNNASDITSIAAGNDFVGGSYVLYGPGTFVLQAGHDLGPFTPSVYEPSQTSGIATLGNGSALGNTFGSMFAVGADPVKPYLPAQGAEIDVLFGVKPGIDYAAAINQYIDPARAGTGGIDLLAGIATALGQPRDQAWTTFQGLSPARQRLLVNRAFLDFVIQVGKDYKNPSSPYFGQYARAYTAISTLFPAGLGYTDNSLSVDGNAAPKIATGKLNIAASVLETQMGGDINIVGPGGGITVGHTSLDILRPNQEGILTLGGGSIRAFADDSILVNQSRIMTQQGGDIGLFVANGDINAGSGPKTYVSSPAVSVICTVVGYCYTNPQGLITGAGIAALVTLPGQDPTRSNVTLVAPRGTIDLGAAGIRGNDITLVAQVVLNSFNIQSTGTVTGLAFTPPPNTALAAVNNNATAATQQAGQPGPAKPNDQPSIVIVEVVGYGGGGGDGETPSSSGGGGQGMRSTNDDDERRRREEAQ